MEITRGSLVYSRSGRDKGGLFLTVAAKDGYVYIADGKTRKVESPKKKKLKHINKTNTVLELEWEEISDSDVRKALESYQSR